MRQGHHRAQIFSTARQITGNPANICRPPLKTQLTQGRDSATREDDPNDKGHHFGRCAIASMTCPSRTIARHLRSGLIGYGYCLPDWTGRQSRSLWPCKHTTEPAKEALQRSAPA